MRLEIKSTDRIGISQEILTNFASHSWDVESLEVVTCFTYALLNVKSASVDDVANSLSDISGIEYCKEIDLLPFERRENHLQALLDRIPDPIIDLDENGKILAVNKATRQLFKPSNKLIEGNSIEQYIDQSIQQLLEPKATSSTVMFLERSYIADINPVMSGTNVTGSMITLRNMNTLGRQIALMQTRKEQGISNIIGESSKLRLIKEQTERYAELDLPVLISGETGTGKELIARALHNASQRSTAPFLAINCAALPEHLLESELFGYASGAFTGAQKGGKPGLFELASGGTVFLDEIAEMSVYLQAKLLRFLQDFTYRKVGGTKELKANVRIISASHQHLGNLIEQHKFREDLFYRLNVLNLDLPALRDRKEDIPLLVTAFIKNAAQQVNQKVPVISEGAMQILQAYSWPGNIRQLQNILFRAVALNTKEVIEQEDLSHILFDFDKNDIKGQTEISLEVVTDWASAQSAFELKLLSQLYPHFPTTRKLAKRLNVSHNKIAMKLREHHLGD